MANRYFTQWLWSMEKNPATLWAFVTFGAAGAPTLSGINSKGIKTFEKQATGAYLITLGSQTGIDKYQRTMFAKSTPIVASGAPAAPKFYIRGDYVHDTGIIAIEFLGPDAHTPTNPASGEKVLIELRMQTSTAN